MKIKIIPYTRINIMIDSIKQTLAIHQYNNNFVLRFSLNKIYVSSS